jgi:hypothetical protein
LFERTEFNTVIKSTKKNVAEHEADQNGNKLFNEEIENRFKDDLLHDYIHDFILYNCTIKTLDDLNLITKKILNRIAKRIELNHIDLKICLSVVQYKYEKLRMKIDLYLKIYKT